MTDDNDTGVRGCSEAPIDSGKSVYLNAEELWQLRRDLEMLHDLSDVPDAVCDRRENISDKIGRSP